MHSHRQFSKNESHDKSTIEMPKLALDSLGNANIESELDVTKRYESRYINRMTMYNFIF